MEVTKLLDSCIAIKDFVAKIEEFKRGLEVKGLWSYSSYQLVGMSIVDSIVTRPFDDDSMKVERLRNLLAAIKQLESA